MLDLASIMLIPDDTYVKARPHVNEHHLTVAGFGRASAIGPSGVGRLVTSLDTIVRSAPGPISAKANGVGLFDAGIDGFAFVDLIDSVGLLRVRTIVERLFGGNSIPSMSRLHGFTPHITRRYYNGDDGFYGEVSVDDIDNVEFQFKSIAVWAGDVKHEVSL
jgi:hypothetical protein